MEEQKVKCVWCDKDFPAGEMFESRFLGGQVCPGCDADEPRKNLGDIHAKLKQRSSESVRAGEGWVK